MKCKCDTLCSHKAGKCKGEGMQWMTTNQALCKYCFLILRAKFSDKPGPSFYGVKDPNREGN